MFSQYLTSPMPGNSKRNRTNPLVSPPSSKPDKIEPTNPLITPPTVSRPRRRSSLMVVWPPPKPGSSKDLGLGSQSYHTKSSESGSIRSHQRNDTDLGSQSYHLPRSTEASPAYQRNSSRNLLPLPNSCPAGPSTKVKRGSILSKVPAPSACMSEGSPVSDPEMVSPSAARAKLAMVSPGTVQEKLKAFSNLSPPFSSTGSVSQSSPDPNSASGSAGRRMASPHLKKSPSKRLRNRWPPVIKKQESKRTFTSLKAEIRADQVKSALTHFETKSLSAIDSLPFGDEDGLVRQSSKRNLDMGAEIRRRLSKFESRSTPDLSPTPPEETLRSARPGLLKRQGCLKLDVSNHSTSADTTARSSTQSSSSSSMNPIREDSVSDVRLPEIVLPTGQKLPPPQNRKKIRRTNYCIRYEGPTLLRLLDVYGNIPEADERFQKLERKDSKLTAPLRRVSDPRAKQTRRIRLSNSENDSLPYLPKRRSEEIDPSAPSMPQRHGDDDTDDDDDLFGYDGFYDDSGENDGDDDGEVLYAGGMRPDVWITPVKPKGTWKVKRVWNHEEADDHEVEHIVESDDLIGNIRGLLGVPETVDDEELDFTEQESDNDKTSKPFYMKMVFDIGGEIDESCEEVSFNSLGIAEEISNIVQDTSYSDDELADTEDYSDRRTKMVYKAGEAEEDSDDEPDYERMTRKAGGKSADHKTSKAKMVYGGGDDDFDGSDDEREFRRLEKDRPTGAKMVYGNGAEDDDSDLERSFRKMSAAPKGASADPVTSNSNAKMVYGYGELDDDSDLERSFRKMSATAKSAPTTPRSNAKMVYGNGALDDDSDLERSFRKMSAATKTAKSKEANSDGSAGYDSEDSSSEMSRSEGQADNSTDETVSKSNVKTKKQPRRSSYSGDSRRDIPDFWVSGMTGATANKQHFKKTSWVIDYPQGEEPTEPSSASTSDVDEPEKRTPRVLPWEKKVVKPPEKEKKQIKLWFLD